MLVKINQSFLLQAEGIMQTLVGSHLVSYIFLHRRRNWGGAVAPSNILGRGA